MTPDNCEMTDGKCSGPSDLARYRTATCRERNALPVLHPDFGLAYFIMALRVLELLTLHTIKAPNIRIRPDTIRPRVP